jgi:GAF domain-containing protein
MYDFEAITRVSAELNELLLNQTPLDRILSGIGNLAVAVIPSCEEAGVTLEDKGRVVARTTTGDVSRTVDAYQYDIDEGPCIHASQTGSKVLIEDMGAEERWPRFASFAHGQGVRSSYSIPMVEGGEHFGVLNLYSIDDSFGAPDEEVGGMFAREATNAVRHAAAFAKTRELINNLKTGLESRSVIGAAVGILMNRDNLSMGDAFDKLVGISQRENMKLRDVAERFTQVYESEAAPVEGDGQGAAR